MLLHYVARQKTRKLHLCVAILGYQKFTEHGAELSFCVQVERYKAVRTKGKEVSTSESRSRLLLSSCSTDQFYNYVTKVSRASVGCVQVKTFFESRPRTRL